MNSLADQLKGLKIEKEFGSSDIALLAPVPKVLLDSAIDPPWSGHVAFGSRNFEAFRKLDEIRKKESVDTLIYESHTDDTPISPRCIWQASYIKAHETDDGSLDKNLRKKLRTPAMLSHPADIIGHWAVYWEVKNLRKIDSEEIIKIGDLCGLDRKAFYKHGFIPRGPVIIIHP